MLKIDKQFSSEAEEWKKKGLFASLVWFLLGRQAKLLNMRFRILFHGRQPSCFTFFHAAAVYMEQLSIELPRYYLLDHS